MPQSGAGLPAAKAGARIARASPRSTADVRPFRTQTRIARAPYRTHPADVD
jgi:hypothetical protein